MQVWILVPAESEILHFSLLLCFAKGLCGTSCTNEKLRIVLKGHAMDQPQVQMIGLEATQGLFQHLHREACIAAVSADLGHEKCFISMSLESLTEPIFRFAAVVFPAAVVEGDSAVECAMHYFDGGLFVLCGPKVVATQAERRNFRFCFSESTERNLRHEIYRHVRVD
jgi:hypothetical protein